MKLYYKNSDRNQDFIQSYWKPLVADFISKFQGQQGGGAKICLKGEPGTDKEEVARAIHFMTKGDTVLLCVGRETILSGVLPPVQNIGTVFVDGVDYWHSHEQQAVAQFAQKHTGIHLICGTTQSVPAGFSFVYSVPNLKTRGAPTKALEEAVQAFRSAGKSINEFSAETRQALEAYAWPGNDEEARAVMKRAAYTCNSGADLTPGKLGLTGQNVVAMRPKLEVVSTNGMNTPVMSPEEAAEGYMTVKKKWSEQFEREYLIGALNRHAGNVSAAAREAKIDRSNFLRLLRKYAIKAQAFRSTKMAA